MGHFPATPRNSRRRFGLLRCLLLVIPISDANGIGVESVLSHASGEFVSERVVIPLTEEKGKTRVQCAGSTLTYLRRYSWAAILGMYSDEDSDGGSPVQAFAPKGAPMLPPPPMKSFQNN